MYIPMYFGVCVGHPNNTCECLGNDYPIQLCEHFETCPMDGFGHLFCDRSRWWFQILSLFTPWERIAHRGLERVGLKPLSSFPKVNIHINIISIVLHPLGDEYIMYTPEISNIDTNSSNFLKESPFPNQYFG